MIEYKDSGNVDCVLITYEDGSIWSGTKEAYLASLAELEKEKETNKNYFRIPFESKFIFSYLCIMWAHCVKRCAFCVM